MLKKWYSFNRIFNRIRRNFLSDALVFIPLHQVVLTTCVWSSNWLLNFCCTISLYYRPSSFNMTTRLQVDHLLFLFPDLSYIKRSLANTLRCLWWLHRTLTVKQLSSIHFTFDAASYGCPTMYPSKYPICYMKIMWFSDIFKINWQQRQYTAQPMYMTFISTYILLLSHVVSARYSDT